MLTSVVSRADSISNDGDSASVSMGGNGDGARGPSGRRSADEREVGRPLRGESDEGVIERWSGGVVEPRLLPSLSINEDPAREAGRNGKGGSSKEAYVSFPFL